MTRPPPRRGFTLVEVLMAVVLAAIVAGACTTVLSALARARQGAGERARAASRAAIATDMIALDVMRVAREQDLYWTRVLIVDRTLAGTERDQLLLVSRSRQRVRGESDSPEGSDFEVAYRVVSSAEGPGLWRRADPALDQYQDAGGVITRISDGVETVRLEAYDGESWFDEWDSDLDGLPHAIRITVEARSDEGKGRSTARRVVAIDRTPIPFPAEES